MTDPRKNVVDFHVLNQEFMHIDTDRDELFADTDLKTNVVIASMTTSWARLKLWCIMRRLGDRVLYTDTDSVIFEWDTHRPLPWDVGDDFLGDLSDELTCKKVGCAGCDDGHWIQEFVACGPKNYGYKVHGGPTIVKIRGFTLTHDAGRILNYDSMKEALRTWYYNNDNAKPLVTVSTQIARDKHHAVVYNRQVPKHYGIVYDKNVVLKGFNTLPYGHADIPPP